MVAVLQPTGNGKLIAIDRAVVLVGRSADCDVVITNSKKISRKHCCLVQVDDSYFIRDLGSMNGCWLNGQRVSPEATITAGDKVAIGDVEFMFHPNARVNQPGQDESSPRRVALADASQNSPVLLLDEESVTADSGDVIDVDDVEVLPDDDIEVIDDVEPIDAVEVIDEIEVVEDVVVVDEVEVLDEVEVINDSTSPKKKKDDYVISLDDSFSEEEILFFDEE